MYTGEVFSEFDAANSVAVVNNNYKIESYRDSNCKILKSVSTGYILAELQDMERKYNTNIRGNSTSRYRYQELRIDIL